MKNSFFKVDIYSFVFLLTFEAELCHCSATKHCPICSYSLIFMKYLYGLYECTMHSLLSIFLANKLNLWYKNGNSK